MDTLRVAEIPITPTRLRLSYAAHLITPAHRALDQAQEASRGQGKIGTTLRGIGPAYTSKVSRQGLRLVEMLDRQRFAETMRAHVQEINRYLTTLYAAEPLDAQRIVDEFDGYAAQLTPYITDVSTLLTEALSGYGFVYYVAAFYYVFGRNQLLLQLLNATIGSVTVLVVYAIGHRLFGHAVARWAALFMAFFPQMLFWSAGMYKDPSVLLCIALAMFAVLRLRESFSPGMAVVLGVAFMGLLALRFYIFYFVALAALAAFVFGMRGRIGQRLLSYGLVILALVGAFSIAVKKETLEVQSAFITLEQMQV